MSQKPRLKMPQSRLINHPPSSSTSSPHWFLFSLHNLFFSLFPLHNPNSGLITANTPGAHLPSLQTKSISCYHHIMILIKNSQWLAVFHYLKSKLTSLTFKTLYKPQLQTNLTTFVLWLFTSTQISLINAPRTPQVHSCFQVFSWSLLAPKWNFFLFASSSFPAPNTIFSRSGINK